MGGGNEIDIVSSFFLKFQKNLGQTLDRNFFSEVIMAESMVLAKYTLQVAAGKEDSSASSRSADTGLLSEMGRGSGNNGYSSRFAKALALVFVKSSESIAFTGTGRTKHFFNNLHRLSDFSYFNRKMEGLQRV